MGPKVSASSNGVLYQLCAEAAGQQQFSSASGICPHPILSFLWQFCSYARREVYKFTSMTAIVAAGLFICLVLFRTRFPPLWLRILPARDRCLANSLGGAQGIVIVQFEKKQYKITVFKARGKLAGTTIGLDDDLTILQQQRKNATWPAFKDFRSRGVKTQWRAEKLFVKEGEHFVEHKVLNL